MVIQSCSALCDPMYCPWDSLGKNTGAGSHSLLQGIFPTQGLSLGFLRCSQILYHLSHQGSPLTSLEMILKADLMAIVANFCKNKNLCGVLLENPSACISATQEDPTPDAPSLESVNRFTGLWSCLEVEIPGSVSQTCTQTLSPSEAFSLIIPLCASSGYLHQFRGSEAGTGIWINDWMVQNSQRTRK